MPAVIPVHAALRSRLKDSVQHALRLNAQLEAVVAVKPVVPGGFHGKIDHSSPPGCVPVLMAIMDLHALCRDAEACLRIAQKLPKRARGGSSANTRIALESLLRLSEAADDHSVKENARTLDSWSRKASIVLSQTEAPRRLPRIEGQKEPKCPFCENHTLRMFPLYGIIKCLNPECKDDEDRKPVAKLEYFEHEFVLRWQDSVIGVPA